MTILKNQSKEKDLPTENQINYANFLAKKFKVKLPKEKTKKSYFNFIALYDTKFKKFLKTSESKYEELKNIERREYYFCEKNFWLIKEKLQEVSGVYFLWNNDELVYIGKSIDLSNRIINSIKERQTSIHITHFSYYRINNYADMHITEPILITKYKPKLNTEFGTIDVSRKYKTNINPYKLKKYVAYIKKGENYGTKKR